MQSLAVQASAAQLSGSLRAAGIPLLLLKGVTLERWLYTAEELRPSGDVDILVAPGDLAAAEQCLAALGYRNRYDGASPAFADEHADTWVSPVAAVPIDLHRHVWGCRARPDLVWRRFWETRTQLKVATETIDVLGEPARALAVVLHAAHHGKTAQRPLEDLRRLLAASDRELWHEVRHLAEELDALHGLSAGLTLLPAGAEVHAELELTSSSDAGSPSARPPMWSAPQTTEGFLRLGDLPGVRAKARLLAGELVPSAAFMKTRSPFASLARRGRAGLIVAYVLRAGLVVVNSPRGLREARRIRASEEDRAGR